MPPGAAKTPGCSWLPWVIFPEDGTLQVIVMEGFNLKAATVALPLGKFWVRVRKEGRSS